MKTFADWTDEIRALMNPPAPVADTCNLSWDWALKDMEPPKVSAVDLGTAIHTAWEVQAKRWPRVDPKWLEWADTRAVEFRKELLGEFKIDDAFYDKEAVKWDPAELGADTTGTAMAQRQREKMDRLGLMYGCGRRTGKSLLQNEWYRKAMDFLASHDYSKLEERLLEGGSVLWGFNPTGEPTITVYDEYTTFDPELLGTIKIDGKFK